MTRLAAVLARAWHSCRPTCEGETPAGHTCDLIAESVVAAIPEDVRDALEAALDVCVVCDWDERAHYHHCAVTDGTHPNCHPYQPLGDAP